MDFQSLRTRLIIETQTLLEARPTLKYVLFVQLLALLISLVSPVFNFLILVPSDLFRMHLWRIVSNLFLENNLIVMAWTTYCFQQFILYIQPNWPIEEIVKYIIIVQLGSVFSFVISTLLLYIFTGALYVFYYAQIYGPSALAVAALMSLKQFLPDNVLITTSIGRLKNGHLPFTFLILFFLFWAIGLVRGTIPFQLLFSTQISWIYLRFFQSRGGIGQPMIGDRSEHFSWASLFPRRIQPIATIIGRLTFRTIRRLGILKCLMRRENFDYIEEQTFQMEALEVNVTSPGAAVLAPESWEAERKRQKALRMLNERLANKNTNADNCSIINKHGIQTTDIHLNTTPPQTTTKLFIDEQQSNATSASQQYIQSNFLNPPISDNQQSFSSSQDIMFEYRIPTTVNDKQQQINEQQKINDKVLGYY